MYVLDILIQCCYADSCMDITHSTALIWVQIVSFNGWEEKLSQNKCWQKQLGTCDWWWLHLCLPCHKRNDVPISYTNFLFLPATVWTFITLEIVKSIYWIQQGEHKFHLCSLFLKLLCLAYLLLKLLYSHLQIFIFFGSLIQCLVNFW